MRWMAAMSVTVQPGAIAVTAMPSGPSARARDWVKETMAALEAPYAGWFGSPRKAPREETLTMRPPRVMWRTAHQVTLDGPIRLTASVSAHACCHSAYVVSRMRWGW